MCSTTSTSTEIRYSFQDFQDDFETNQWLDVLLRQFIACERSFIYPSKQFAPRVVPALRELVRGRTTDMLHTLRNIFVEGLQPSGPVQERDQAAVCCGAAVLWSPYSRFLLGQRWDVGPVLYSRVDD